MVGVTPSRTQHSRLSSALVSVGLCGCAGLRSLIRPAVFVGGIVYVWWYKKNVLDKVRYTPRSAQYAVLTRQAT